jgi:hypothetical protein
MCTYQHYACETTSAIPTAGSSPIKQLDKALAPAAREMFCLIAANQ